MIASALGQIFCASSAAEIWSTSAKFFERTDVNHASSCRCCCLLCSPTFLIGLPREQGKLFAPVTSAVTSTRAHTSPLTNCADPERSDFWWVEDESGTRA
eukprot:755681-Prymnesium_polylepis.1